MFTMFFANGKQFLRVGAIFISYHHHSGAGFAQFFSLFLACFRGAAYGAEYVQI